jgi:hypothetical protein
MRKDFSNMDGVIEQFDAVSSISPIRDRFDQDNFYPANGKRLKGNRLKKAFSYTPLAMAKKSGEARQKRKAVDAQARLVAAKGLAKSAQNDKELSRVLSTTKKVEKKKELSTFAKVGIGVGIAAVLGIGAYFLLKKK